MISTDSLPYFEAEARERQGERNDLVALMPRSRKARDDAATAAGVSPRYVRSRAASSVAANFAGSASFARQRCTVIRSRPSSSSPNAVTGPLRRCHAAPGCFSCTSHQTTKLRCSVSLASAACGVREPAEVLPELDLQGDAFARQAVDGFGPRCFRQAIGDLPELPDQAEDFGVLRLQNGRTVHDAPLPFVSGSRTSTAAGQVASRGGGGVRLAVMSPVRVRLKELRAAARMSQAELARRADVRRATVIELEAGTARRVTLTVLERLARALGVPVGELLVSEPPVGPRRRAK
jgi:DNA-binding Xre family transcriptional regulator